MRCKLSEENAREHNLPVGGFTPWQDLPQLSDCLFYEGMHGGVVADSWTRRKQQLAPPGEDRRSARNNGVNVAQYVDLLIGVVPAINLQWIQRIHHERVVRKRSAEETTDHIVQQLQDYIYFIVPQFSLCDITFQRMPVVDTSNPFDLERVPADYESMLVVSFREADKHDVTGYVQRIPNARLSGRKSLLIPGGQLQHALDVICAPLIEALVAAKS
jgi:phosphoribulokinase